MGVFQAVLENELIVLFLVVGLGMLLGGVSIRGLGLGSSGVLFAALLAGHLGLAVPSGLGSFGLALFVYCVGIGAGPRFFPALAREGGGLARLALALVACGAAVAWLSARLFKLPADLAAGLFAGALTSTPALASATESAGKGVAIGYGIAYPFGVVGVVLFVQLMPRLFRQKPSEQGVGAEAESDAVRNVLVDVGNANLYGKLVSETNLSRFGCQVSRVLREGRLAPMSPTDRFESGQSVLLVGSGEDVERAVEYLGRPSERSFVMDTDRERQRLVVTDKTLGGHSLEAIAPFAEFGVTVTRISRLGHEFVPTPSTKVEAYDVLTVVGESDRLSRFSKRVGHRPQAFDQTDLISLAIGLSAGIFCGMVPISLPGGEPMTLGLAGGPLFVALVLGYFGRVGRVVGHIPRPTRVLLQELGLVLFLANAGITGGAHLAEAIAQYGASVFVAGALITLAPLLLAYPLARKAFGLSQEQALGGICGGMTSTPALGALASSSRSQQPIVSYATAYPVALILMTVLAKLLLQALELGSAAK